MNTTTTNGQSTANNAETTTYLWILSLQWPSGGGFSTSTSYGTFLAPAGTSRKDVYEAVRERAVEELRIPNGGTTLFFSCEPDALG